jgi:hypothetical protein
MELAQDDGQWWDFALAVLSLHGLLLTLVTLSLK